MEKRGYTYAEAAQYLGVSEELIKKTAAAGDLPRKYFRSKPLIDVRDLDNFFDSLPADRPA